MALCAHPRRKFTNARYLPRFRCADCSIKIKTARGKCDDCATRAPLIQHHTLLGAERFYQTLTPRVNLYAEVAKTYVPRVRGPYRTKSGNRR